MRNVPHITREFTVKIRLIKPNPQNPRTIRDDRFEALCKSLREFPEMLHKRPLVCFTDTDGKYVVLGGNMRLKAANEVGIKELPILLADDWNEEQKAQFLIKDNVGFGEWEWEMLVNDWDVAQLEDWGLNIPDWAAGLDVNNMTDEDVDLTEAFDPVGVSAGQQRIVIIFDGQEEAQSWIDTLPDLKKVMVKRNMAWQVNLSTPYTS